MNAFWQNKINILTLVYNLWLQLLINFSEIYFFIYSDFINKNVEKKVKNMLKECYI